MLLQWEVHKRSNEWIKVELLNDNFVIFYVLMSWFYGFKMGKKDENVDLCE